ncbi:MAG: antitoxin family protein [Armatimonadota bacterium]
MSKVIEAVYDGRVLVPLQPLDLQAGDRVRISVKPSVSTSRPRRERRRKVLEEMWHHFEQTPPPSGPLSQQSISRESIYEGRA